MKLKTASPIEIDSRIAELHSIIAGTQETADRLTNRVLDRAGLRKYVPATWGYHKAGYEISGTFEEGLEILRTYYAAWAEFIALPEPRDYKLAPASPCRGITSRLDLDELIRERSETFRTLDKLWREADAAEAEYLRRPWSRYFLVISSPGHIHSSTACQTCKFTTRYGWMPEKSGMTEAEAIASLGPWAESLCSVCFPTAPVAGKLKITKAKAEKASTATFVAKS